MNSDLSMMDSIVVTKNKHEADGPDKAVFVCSPASLLCAIKLMLLGNLTAELWQGRI